MYIPLNEKELDMSDEELVEYIRKQQEERTYEEKIRDQRDIVSKLIKELNEATNDIAMERGWWGTTFSDDLSVSQQLNALYSIEELIKEIRKETCFLADIKREGKLSE